jgi:integrase
MPTLQRLYRDYCDAVLVSQRSGKATARSLGLLIEPLGRVQAASVRRDHVARRLEEIAETAPVHAKRILSYARAFFAWASAHSEMEEDPTWGIYIPVEDRARGRQLTLKEVLMIWRAADVLGERLAYAVRLLILTAAPRQQVSGLRLSELERDTVRGRLEWRPTALKELRGEAPPIVLSPMAREIVEAAVVGRRPDGEFILSRTGKTPLDGWSKAKRALDEELARMKGRGQFEPWWLNDLRMSFPALAVEHAGVDPIVAEARLGRVSRFWHPDDKMWVQFHSTAEMASQALADWDAVLARELGIAKAQS